MENTITRAALIEVMTDGGCTLAQINEKLAAHGHAAITDAEALALKLALPATVLASDIVTDADKPKEVNRGAILGQNPITGENFDQLNLAVVTLCANVSKILKTCDPDAWAQYKAIKATKNEADRRKAYLFAFERLLALGYCPTTV
jgi:sigma54-dependent transcription regulator